MFCLLSNSFGISSCFLLALAGAEFDVPLCCRMMSVRLVGTPAGLRTVLWHEGKEVEIPPPGSPSEH